MDDSRTLQALPDDELLRRLSDLVGRSRHVESDVIAHIAEVDARRLYVNRASPSMFAYATEVLHLSEHEAYLRITVARASREHPVLLQLLADGRLHLSGIAKLVPHLTRENRETLLQGAVHRTKRQIEELIAGLAPRPDVPARVRKLPEPHRATAPSRDLAASEDPAVVVPRAAQRPLPPRPSVVEPLAPSRYRVQFTASSSLQQKLERLQALTPGADLAQVVEQAVTERLERLEAKRFALVKKPRKRVEEADPTPSSRYIPAPLRRAVHERDGGRCTYVDASGRRCAATRNLEYHHHGCPYGRGGDHSVDNLRLCCRAHNALLAEQEYGRGAMSRFRRSPDRVSESAGGYRVARQTLRTRSGPSTARPSRASAPTPTASGVHGSVHVLESPRYPTTPPSAHAAVIHQPRRPPCSGHPDSRGLPDRSGRCPSSPRTRLSPARRPGGRVRRRRAPLAQCPPQNSPMSRGRRPGGTALSEPID